MSCDVLSCERPDVSALAAAFRNEGGSFRFLETLDLLGNNIGDCGIMEILDAVQVNTMVHLVNKERGYRFLRT